jgi:nucleobase transporter 1/2
VENTENTAPKADNGLIYSIEDKPPLLTSMILGLQHYLTMLGATVLIPMILGQWLGVDDKGDLALLIGTIFFASGISTLLQTTLGNRLPIVQGGTFSFLGPTLAICGMAAVSGAGWEVKMQHVQGAIILGAFVEIAVGYLGLAGRLLKYIGPITIAPTIALIGLALFNVGAPFAGKDWYMGGATIFFVVMFSQYMQGSGRFFQMFPILLAITLAWGLAAFGTWTGHYQPGDASHVSTTVVGESQWIRIPYPFQWGWPVFGVAAFIGMLAGYLASMIESIGDYYACARLSGAPIPTKKTINRGIGMEGVGCLIAGVLGTGNGTTSYSENIGAIGLTKVGSRRVVQSGAVLMIILGAFGKFGALFATVPLPIVGGMFCALFGMIAAVGLSNLQFVDLNSARNLFIIGFSLFMGLTIPSYFTQTYGLFGIMQIEGAQWLGDIVTAIGKSGMSVGAIIAFVLDNTVPGTDEERGLLAWRETKMDDTDDSADAPATETNAG